MADIIIINIIIISVIIIIILLQSSRNKSYKHAACTQYIYIHVYVQA